MKLIKKLIIDDCIEQDRFCDLSMYKWYERANNYKSKEENYKSMELIIKSLNLIDLINIDKYLTNENFSMKYFHEDKRIDRKHLNQIRRDKRIIVTQMKWNEKKTKTKKEENLEEYEIRD